MVDDNVGVGDTGTPREHVDLCSLPAHRRGIPAGARVAREIREARSQGAASASRPHLCSRTLGPARAPFTQSKFTGRTRYGFLSSGLQEGLCTWSSGVSLDSVEWTPFTLAFEVQKGALSGRGHRVASTALNGSAGGSFLTAKVRVIQEESALG